MKEKGFQEDFKGINSCVVLHNIRSCYNIGSIFRTSDALGVDKIFLGGYTPNPGDNRAIKKTALGAENMVSWNANWHTYKILKTLKKAGFTIIALELTKDSVDLNEFIPKKPFALILGNEISGLSENILKYADLIVQIPMLGGKESMNVSVSYGIAMYTINKK